MTQQDHLATIQAKQDQATSACQRATLLLQQNPDAATLQQIAADLVEAQAAVAVIAHCLEDAESLIANDLQETDFIPIPPEPLDEVVSPAYEAATVAAVPEAVIEEVIAVTPSTMGNTNPSSGPSLLEKLSESPLENIQMALSINDRVRFSAILAEGDMARFNQLCATVDSADNLEGALRSVHSSCSHITSWDDEEEAPFQFLQRVQRVFS